MTIKNKLGITNSAELARKEEKLSKKRALELFDSGLLNELEAGSFASLQAIHKQLFQDIYEFAGQVRYENIAKGNFRFVSAMYLQEAIKQIERMPQSNFDEIVEKYVEINVAHPFREGNGRSMRIWLDLIFKKELNMAVDWSRINESDYLAAMERSPIKDLEIKFLLKNALTDAVDNREVYMRGIDASYLYEGYDEFKMQELEQR